MLTFNAITHTCNMGRNQTKTCNVCLKAMRDDVLTMHTKRYDSKTVNEDKIVTNGQEMIWRSVDDG